MNLNEFYEDTPKSEIQVVEDQLVLAKQLQQQLIDFEKQKKAIDKAEKELKKKLEEVMRTNGISSYESNDKRIRISLGEDSTIESIDKDKLFMEYPEAYRECMKETKRKGTLRITIREEDNGEM